MQAHRHLRDVLCIGLLSATVAAAVVVCGHLIWYGDSHTYTDYALDMADGILNPTLSWRTPGYSAILLLTGFAWTRSLTGIVIVQAVAGALIPVLTYLILALFNRRIALLVSAFAVVTLIPFSMVTTIYPDELYMFALVLVAYLLIRWTTETGRLRHLYALGAATLMLAWLRPAGWVVSILVLAAVLHQRKRMIHVFVCLLLVYIAFSNYAWLQSVLAGPAPRGTFGRQVFFNVYMNSGGLDVSGSWGQRFQTRLTEFFREAGTLEEMKKHLPIDESSYERWFGPHAGDPERLVSSMLNRPSKDHYWLLYSAPLPDSDYFMVAAGHFRRHPMNVISGIAANFKGLTFGPAWFHHESAPLIQEPYFEPAMPARGIKAPSSLESPPSRPVTVPDERINAIFAVACAAVVPAAYLLTLVGVFGFIRSAGPARTAVVAIFAIHACTVVVLALLVDPQFRYQLHGLPLAMIGAGLGLYRLRTLALVQRGFARLEERRALKSACALATSARTSSTP